MNKTLAAALALLVAGSAAPSLADETTGLILAYDRQANILILTDKTVWELPGELAVPADLGHGDRVILAYESAGEDGLTAITELKRTAIALRNDEDGGS